MRRHLLKVWLTRCKAVKPASGAALRGAASFHFQAKRGFLAGNPRGGVSGEGERPRLRVTRSPHSTGKSHCSQSRIHVVGPDLQVHRALDRHVIPCPSPELTLLPTSAQWSLGVKDDTMALFPRFGHSPSQLSRADVKLIASVSQNGQQSMKITLATNQKAHESYWLLLSGSPTQPDRLCDSSGGHHSCTSHIMPVEGVRGGG